MDKMKLKNLIKETVNISLTESAKDKKIEQILKDAVKSSMSDLKYYTKQYGNFKINPKVTWDGGKCTIDFNIDNITPDYVGRKTIDRNGSELEKIKTASGIDFESKGSRTSQNFLLYSDNLDGLVQYLTKNGYKHQLTNNKKAIRIAKKS